MNMLRTARTTTTTRIQNKMKEKKSKKMKQNKTNSSRCRLLDCVSVRLNKKHQPKHGIETRKFVIPFAGRAW